MAFELPYPVSVSSLDPFGDPREWTGQIKSDGVRLAVVYDEDCEASSSLTKGGKQLDWAPSGLPVMAPGTVIDGELVADGTWQGAQAALQLGDAGAAWVAFDILVDPLGVVPDKDADDHVARVRFLKERGFEIARTGPVPKVWEMVQGLGAEGVVVRARRGDKIFKYKTRQELDVLVHRGKAFLTEGKNLHLLGSIPKQPDGMVRVSCEGRADSGKLRAMKVIGPPRGLVPALNQLEGIRS